MKKTQEYNIGIFIAFVDFTKAFDSVEHEFVWKALTEQGIPQKYVRLLAKLYDNSQAKIRTEREGEPFALGRGVKQGDPLSPKLFTALLESQIRKLNWDTEHGININGVNLTHLRFADDIVLVARSAEKLEQMLIDLEKTSAEAGLQMNPKKTQVMTNVTELPININGTPIEYVPEYVYLGQNLAFHYNIEKEVKRRIGQAWKKFWSLNFILKDATLKTSTKAEVLEKCVLPVLTYGSQTWSLNGKTKHMIQVCQRKMERMILRVSLRDKIRNEDIRRTTGLKDAIDIAEGLKWQWGGHVARMQSTKWTYRATMWDPRTGKRRVGRQKTRWADSFVKRAGHQWTRLARNRGEWKQQAPGRQR